MSIEHVAPTRRALLAGCALSLVAAAGPAEAARKRPRAEGRSETDAPKGTLLPIPALVEPKPGEVFDLVAEPATHAFLTDKPVPVIGYGGGYMGPALKLTRGTACSVRLVNRLDRSTNVHWHGLLVDGANDGGVQPAIEPGATWEVELAVDQPSATLWYHAHVHGRTTKDVHDGLAGLLIVESEKSALDLPSTWGVDDLPLVLQDRDFDPNGNPIMPPLAASLEHGFRGATMIVNGVADAFARVPERLVRLRLLNASGARTWRLAFEDRRSFQLIATDGGFLDAPVELSFLPLSPGERAEILVDFAAGPSPLLTEPDVHEHRTGREVHALPDVISGPTRVLAFETKRDDRASHAVPRTLVALPPRPESTLGLTRRRFELRVAAAPVADEMDHAAMMHADSDGDEHAGHGGAAAKPLLTINGKAFAMGRIDEKVPFGATEVWEIVSPEMTHPFHVHGAHFRVLSEDGDRPKLWNEGVKDTVRVENSAELLVTFTRRADAKAPFVYHCHLLEHEDGGMMGTFTVG